MFARTLPALKIDQLVLGPMLQKELEDLAISVRFMLAWPMFPVREKRGHRSAVATPILAVAAASCCSVLRTSGLLRSRSEGSPTGTSGGSPGIGATSLSSSTRR